MKICRSDNSNRVICALMRVSFFVLSKFLDWFGKQEGKKELPSDRRRA
jgi:hypothetical protein